MQSFWKKRFLKIYLPYLICGLLCYFLKNIWIMNEDLSAIGVLKRITGYDAIWFIKALLIFYIAFWFIYKFFSKKGNLLMGIFIIGYILICFSLKVDKTWYGSVIPFYIGIILADNIEKIKKAKVNILFLSICGVLACGMEVLYIIFKDDVCSTVRTHNSYLCCWPCHNHICSKMLRAHCNICTAISLSCYNVNLRNCCLRISI